MRISKPACGFSVPGIDISPAVMTGTYEPAVSMPSEVGRNRKKFPLPPDTPATANEPRVERVSDPSGRAETESSCSLVVVRPTSEPSKCIDQVPAVTEPREVGWNRMTSWAVIETPPGSVPFPFVESRIAPSASTVTPRNE